MAEDIEAPAPLNYEHSEEEVEEYSSEDEYPVDDADYTGIEFMDINLNSTGTMKQPTYPLIVTFKKQFTERLNNMFSK